MAPLDRTFALSDIDDIAVLVGKKLDFDVARLNDEFLDEHTRITECGLCLAHRRAHAVGQLIGAFDDTHALATAAGGGLDHDRVADFLRRGERGIDILNGAWCAGDNRDTCGFGQRLGFNLVPHDGDRLRTRANKDQSGRLDGIDEIGVLGQEPEPGVDGLGAGLLCRLDDSVRTKIAVRRSRTADMNRLVRHRDMRRAGIGIGIDRNCGDPHALGSPHDPAGDFPSIGNQDFTEHGVSARHRDGGYSGRLSCLRAGFSSCLSASIVSARAILRRELRGMMMSSR